MTNFFEFVYGIEYILKNGISEQSIEKNNKLKKNNNNNLQDFNNQKTNSFTSIECLEKIRCEVLHCTKCRLSTNRTNVVFGEGPTNIKLMFVGEGPGYEEDRQGRPFVGRAGQLLTKMIQAMGFNREDVYIANIVKCRPPNNRTPFKDEAEICKPYLLRQIDCLKPSIIVCLGSTAINYLLNLNVSITKIRGKFFDFKDIKVLPTYHPAYLLRNPGKKAEAWEDLQKVMKELLQ